MTLTLGSSRGTGWYYVKFWTHIYHHTSHEQNPSKGLKIIRSLKTLTQNFDICWRRRHQRQRRCRRAKTIGVVRKTLPWSPRADPNIKKYKRRKQKAKWAAIEVDYYNDSITKQQQQQKTEIKVEFNPVLLARNLALNSHTALNYKIWPVRPENGSLSYA